MQDNIEGDFDEEMQKKTRARILAVLLYWKSQGWVTFPDEPTFLDSPETSTES